MEPVAMLCSVLLIFAPYLTHASKTSLPKDMHQDMYCIGCEMTMKVVDRALKNADKQQLDVLVPQTLRSVCKPEHFEISEYSKNTLSNACKHIIKNHGTELKAELVGQYSRAKSVSYLEMVQRVCLTMIDACHGVLHDDHDHDPLKDDARVKLNPETNQFVVLPGKNLKVARPVAQIHEEL